jgi:hypothetical protein
MRPKIDAGVLFVSGAWLLLMALFGAPSVHAQEGPSFTVYGFAMGDAIGELLASDPDWFDAARPTKLPAFDDQFGEDGRFYLSARQSRFGVRAEIPSRELKGQFEFDLYGVGRDAGLTTIRLRHAWGQYKQFGAGQTNSVFMDIDIFPNTLEYWGPSGMLFFRNVMVYWRPIDDGESKLSFAIENPGGSGDGGIYRDRLELEDIVPRFPMPDITAEYRYGDEDWGYVEVAGIFGQLKWDDLLDDAFDFSGSDWRWGGSLSSNIKATSRDVFRLQGIYGEGIQNYFNDAPVDVGVELEEEVDDVGDQGLIEGTALPVFGMAAYLDHNWNDDWSTSIGYSRVDINNSEGQAVDAFHTGQYSSVNLLWVPVEKVLVGGEFLWTRRENRANDFTADDFRVQFSFKYSFDVEIGG